MLKEMEEDKKRKMELEELNNWNNKELLIYEEFNNVSERERLKIIT